MDSLHKIHFKVPSYIDQKAIATLYALSEKSLLAAILLSILVSYFLFTPLGITILLWNALLLTVISYRLYHAVLFRKHQEKYSLDQWYVRFYFPALLTALLFGILALMIIPYDQNTEHHLFIIILILGFSSAASTSLAPDYRLSILYLTITILPLILSMLFSSSTLYSLMSIMVMIYAAIKAAMTIHSYQQLKKIALQQKHIHKVQRILNEKQNLVQHFVNEAPVAIFTYDTSLHITDANDALLRLFNSTAEEIIGLDIHTLPDKQAIQTLQDALLKGSVLYHGSYKTIKGAELWVEIICFSFNDADGNVAGGVGVIHDKTKEHAALTELEFNAKHDHLTSLLNRRGLNTYMQNLITDRRHTTHYSILIYLDLNKFKYINDSLGHQAGDTLLISIAKRLTHGIDERSVIGRFGGDEFIIIFPFVSEREEEAEDIIHHYVEKINQIFTAPFRIEEIDLSIKTSIGIVMIEPGSKDTNELIRQADIAMYLAKKSHQGHISYYNRKMDEERKALFLLQHDLAFAAKEHQFRLYLQPLVSIESDTLIAAECLIRWQHPKLGLLTPDHFIPTAIETGAISHITWWIIEEVCKQINSLKKEGLWHLSYISINIDAKQLLVEHFLDELLSLLHQYDIQTHEIMIEITERSIIDNFEGTQSIINALKREGVHCAIDDFGIGYSSLSYLKKLSFDTLKIDREFIKDIQHRPDDITLIRTILDIGRQFNYDIVVEGIEEKKQKELLFTIDPKLLYQGFLFEKPILFEKFIQKYLYNQ